MQVIDYEDLGRKMGGLENDLKKYWENKVLFNVSLLAFMLMVAGTLLYPDTFARIGIHLGPFRLSATGGLLVLAAPPVTWYIFLNLKQLRLRLIDAAVLSSTIFVTVRGLAANHNNANLLGLTLALAGYILIVYYGAAILGQDLIAIRRFLFLIASVAVVVAAYALIEFFLNKNVLFQSLIIQKVPISNLGHIFHRSGSTLGQPDALGTFLVQALPFMMMFFVCDRHGMRALAWGAGIVVVALAIFVSYAKGSWATVALLAVIVCSWLAWKKPRLPNKALGFLAVAVAISLAALLLIANLNVRYNILSSGRTYESVNMRWISWERAPEVFFDNYLLGTGIWRGPDAISQIAVTSGKNDNETNYLKSHNISIDNLFLSTLVEEGIVGSLLIGLMFFLLGQEAWRLLRLPEQRAFLAIPIVFSMSVVIINGMTYNTLLTWPIMVVFWFDAGLLRSFDESIERTGHAPLYVKDLVTSDK